MFEPGGVKVRGRWSVVLDTIATVLVILVAAKFLFTQGPQPSRSIANRPAAQPTAKRGTDLRIPSTPISLAGAITGGNPSASIAMIVYTDFQCPFCARFARDTMPLIEENYVKPGKLFVAVRNLPLTAIHPVAMNAAKHAVCAAAQEKFWPFHDLVFQGQRQLNDANLRLWSKRVGVDDPKLQACLAGSADSAVEQDMVTAKSLAVSGTPTFFVGTMQAGAVKVSQRFAGAVPFEHMKLILDGLVVSATAER